MQNIAIFVAMILGYLCGSFSSAVVVCRVMGLPDPRSQGSGNPGATNVMRLGGKKAAAITLLGDLLKGFIPVFVLKWLFPEAENVWIAAGLGAFFGHLFPIFFAFKGGKGVATAIGVLLAWSWSVALICIVIWLTVFIITRISSLSALIAAFCAPWLGFIMIEDNKLALAILVMIVMLFYRHRENIRRLRNGEEGAFRKRQ